ncbi:MAG: hypothetical protein E7639_05150 [Ruminococcaceae bacterium]|nr:hypothetical protein [Oscillospiraceae bacterium]
MKKIVAVLLAVVCLFVLSACANTDQTPDGMQNVALESANYYLYVSKNWIPTSYNVSGAKAHTAENAPNILATVYYPEEQVTPTSYWENDCLAEYQAVFTNFTVIGSEVEETLGGKDARAYQFSYTFGATVYQCKQVICVYDFNVYVLTYTAVATEYDSFAADFEAAVDHFTFK